VKSFDFAVSYFLFLGILKRYDLGLGQHGTRT
jgi:hypothetical protein